MRTKLILVLILMLSIASFAQNDINYKAQIKDGSGNVVANQTIDVRFTVIADSGPTNVYLETHTGATTDANGIVILNIGDGTTTDVFTDIAWSSDTHALKVELDIEQDASFVDMGTTQFMTVPYAIHAETAANVITKIDDLSDGKSDSRNYSLFLGIGAGFNDDGSGRWGLFNIGIGYNALYSNELGLYNTATGYAALYFNTGSLNTATGVQALFNNSGGGANTAIGTNSLYSNIDGYSNTASGSSALRLNTSGFQNTASGFEALYNNDDGIRNTASGYQAMYSNTSGNYNTGIGYKTLYNKTTGHWNTALGRNALLDLTSGTNNIGIGYDAQVSNANGNNQVRIGNNQITSLSCAGAYNGIVGVTNRDVYVDNSGKIGYVASSARYKNNIVSMENIDWIFRLEPVNYSYKSDKYNLKQYGLIAEEVEKINSVLISYDNDGNVETVNYSKLIAPMLKAIQEQQDIIEKLEQKNDSYEERLAKLERLITK